MLVGHSHQNEVELVLHKHTCSCYMDAELAAIILIYLLSELIKIEYFCAVCPVKRLNESVFVSAYQGG